jgi:sulfite reductase (NADPH) flavoprotein alpha-component
MSHHHIKSALLLAHRWSALVFTPLFLLVLLSGALLAIQPMVRPSPDSPAAGSTAVDIPSLVSLLDRVDPQGAARIVTIGDAGRTVVLRAGGQGGAMAFQIATGQTVEVPQDGFDLFATARRFHRDLLIGVGFLVEIASYAMVFILLVGPVLAWPRLSNTLIGWHFGIGWILFPLVALPPVTAVLMILHVGGPTLPPMTPAAQPTRIARAIEQAAAQADLSGLASARVFRAGSVLVTTLGPSGQAAYVVSGGRVTPIAGGPGLVHELHEGTWAGAWSGGLNLLAAFALTGLTATGAVSWARRWLQGRKRTGDASADILVAYASQTGRAARLADATAAALRAGGSKVASASLAGVDPAELKGFRHTLLIVSTTGDGEVPEQGRAFLRKLADTDLRGASFALLALGDRRYAGFCAGGETMRTALLNADATEAVEMACADDDPGAAWRTWLDDVSRELGLAAGDVAAPEADRPVTLTLVSRQQLNDPNDPDTHEAWSLLFESAEPLDYRPGDLLLVPPGPGEPERPYSIGSSPLESRHRILLSIGLTRWIDGVGREHIGKASGLLCRTLRAGDHLSASLRHHPAFNPPDEEDRPIILVCAGCGIAPFIGFLAEHETGQRRTPVWLIFGNRKRGGDFFYRDRLQRWLRQGTLSRLDTAFSREPGDGAYAQDRLVQAGADLIDWLTGKNAVLYICGRSSTLGIGVDAAIRTILIEQQAMRPEEATRQIALWEAQGQIRRDLFD